MPTPIRKKLKKLHHAIGGTIATIVPEHSISIAQKAPSSKVFNMPPNPLKKKGRRRAR